MNISITKGYELRRNLENLNNGSHIEVDDREWVLYVKNKNVIIPEKECILLGDSIYTPDIEYKICRVIIE